MQTKSEQRFTPLELETRTTVDTATYCYHMNLAPQTARIHACKERGPIRPIRIPGTAKLHWPVAEMRRVLGIAPRQKGFVRFAYLICILGVGLLIQTVLMAYPGFLASIDLTGVAMLGAGVIGNSDSRQYFNLTDLADAATAQGCIVHLHQEADGRNVFSMGNSNTGAHEFQSVSDAMAYLNKPTKGYTAAGTGD